MIQGNTVPGGIYPAGKKGSGTAMRRGRGGLLCGVKHRRAVARGLRRTGCGGCRRQDNILTRLCAAVAQHKGSGGRVEFGGAGNIRMCGPEDHTDGHKCQKHYATPPRETGWQQVWMTVLHIPNLHTNTVRLLLIHVKPI